jgi:hypothetical protein
MKKLKKILTVLGAIVFGIFIFLIINNYSMNQMVEKEIDEFITEAKQAKVRTFSYKDLEDLPKPVQRYFRYTLKDGQKYIKFARMKAFGLFKRPNRGKKWGKMEVDQYFITERPAFLWDASMRNDPFKFWWSDIRDKYHNSKGDMYVNLFSGFNVLDARGIKKLDNTMFMRFIGEAVLFPTALLPSNYLKWEPIDKNSAKVLVSDGENKGEAICYFNKVGEIVKWVTNGRYERCGDSHREVGTIGYRSEYRDINGIKVPMKFVVTRVLPDGTHEVFWKGEVLDIQFNNLAKY